MTADLAFVDTETTGLDPNLHQIWEVGLIVDGTERCWKLPVDLGRADPIALRIGDFHGRSRNDDFVTKWTPESGASGPLTLKGFATDFARLTRGRHLVGAVISFDEERLRKLLRAHGVCPEWHYHIICVEALAVGYLNGVAQALRRHGRASDPVLSAEWYDKLDGVSLPWKSEQLSRAVGVNPDDFDKHTALGDARWAKAIYEAVTNR